MGDLGILQDRHRLAPKTGVNTRHGHLEQEDEHPAPILLGSLFAIEGETARAAGLDATHNPYREGTQEHANWLWGWLTPEKLPDGKA